MAKAERGFGGSKTQIDSHMKIRVSSTNYRAYLKMSDAAKQFYLNAIESQRQAFIKLGNNLTHWKYNKTFHGNQDIVEFPDDPIYGDVAGQRWTLITRGPFVDLLRFWDQHRDEVLVKLSVEIV
jgi:hypothetical protein